MKRTRLPVALAVLLCTVVGALLWIRYRTSQPSAADSSADLSRNTAEVRDTVDIATKLHDKSWRVRLAAANKLMELDTLSASQKATLLAELLDGEASHPELGPRKVGSYVPLTSSLRLEYLTLITGLGPEAAEGLRRSRRPSSPEGREWRILALGALELAESAPHLRELLASSRDPAVRMTAARYLGHLKDRDAIPLLRQALSDPHTASSLSDTPGRRDTPFYPVREQAAAALESMGFRVERQDHTFTVQ